MKIFRCREQIPKLPRFTGTKIRLKIREFRRCIMMKKTERQDPITEIQASQQEVGVMPGTNRRLKRRKKIEQN